MNPSRSIGDEGEKRNEVSHLMDEVIDEVVDRLSQGESPKLAEYLARYPECAVNLCEIWPALMLIEGRRSKSQTVSRLTMRTSAIEVSEKDRSEPSAADLTGFPDSPNESASDSSQSGAYIGRYVILRRLGQGGFGTVLLARDSELDRLVAIKLPHSRRAANSVNKSMFLREAKTLARLDHPSIVPIYDCGIVPDGRCFVVSKYIEGRDMARVLADGPLRPREIAKFLSTVAEALHYVHRLRLVHRDVKPANLLLGTDGRVYLADFGLALQEGTSSPTEPIAGTPNYMSPEQIRREGHRIDGRSDQYSLGVVMYEFLTGQRPFVSSAAHETFRKVIAEEPIPPCQINPSVPAELNRICLKLLSKLASQRYDETIDLYYDLRDWLKKEPEPNGDLSNIESLLPSTRMLQPEAMPMGGVQPATLVVPKGLRAYTRGDAYFYLDLLPGTRDRDGLPNVLNHWKKWTATTREDNLELHRVGVISGPTGCGKSSLVRAGLLPILRTETVSIVVEATAELTEEHLTTAVDRHCSDHLSGSLTEVLSQIRLGKGIRSGKSILLIIDQFEQWLHFHPDPMQTELVQALRQCDGIRIQCLLLIRDDFWLALSRFMEVLECPMQLGRNITMIDLFDLRHAKKVLIQFGRGYGQLPTSETTLSRDQEKFVDGAIENLTTGGKVIPVHLALFAEMVKHRDWVLATLRQLGGTVGIGAQFLNESFSAMYAPAHQKVHAESARRILQALLPTLGTEIKTGRKTRDELRELAKYGSNSLQFEQLMGILESELKLISAADVLERTRSDATASNTEDTSYQLSHDFLVPSIREWLTAKQRQSWRGRLQQRLSEQAGLWNQRNESRFLPSTWEWVQMRCCIPSSSMNPHEKTMMGAADKRSGLLLLLGFLVVVAVARMTSQVRSQNRIESLIEQLSTADATRAPEIIEELNRSGPVVQASLERKLAGTEMQSMERLSLQLAQLHWSSKPIDEVFQTTIENPRFDFLPIASQALKPFAAELAPKCWNILGLSHSGPDSIDVLEKQMRASQLLAILDPPISPSSMERWKQSSDRTVELLVKSCVDHPDQYSLIADSMRPAAVVLVEPLSQFLGVEVDNSQTRFAISLLERYLKADPDQLTQCYLNASDWQKPMLAPLPNQLAEEVLWKALRTPMDATLSENTQSRSARQAATAASLVWSHSKNKDLSEVVQLLRRSANQTCRTEFIRLIVPSRIPMQRLSDELRNQRDSGIIMSLLLALGEYDPKRVSISSELQAFVEQLFRNHDDAGIHSAAQWLLSQWGMSEAISKLPAESAKNCRNGPTASRNWMRAPHGQTFVRVNGVSEVGVMRNFMIATTEVTAKQFLEFDPNKYINAEYSPLPDCPANVVTWPHATAYCNWLSDQEGLPRFYPTETDVLATWVATEEQLQGLGYRLPTDAEWVLATRAGTTTDFHFGSETDAMVRYEWVKENNRSFREKMGWQLTDPKSGVEIYSSKPVGFLRPNDFGLFDVLGNSIEWCNDGVDLGNSFERAVRGFTAAASRGMRTRDKASFSPLVQYNSMGMRVARTLP